MVLVGEVRSVPLFCFSSFRFLRVDGMHPPIHIIPTQGLGSEINVGEFVGVLLGCGSAAPVRQEKDRPARSDAAVGFGFYLSHERTIDPLSRH